MRILVIEDDPEASSYLVKAFGEAGHATDVAADGLDGYAMAEQGHYDVLIVDRMLPKLDGLSLIGGLRAQKVETPALILSALGQVDDRVKGLRAGGDDYLPKPYSFSELLARVEILARRKPLDSGEPTVYRVGPLELDRLAHKVSRNGKDILVQPREFRLLEYLMRNAGQVVTRTMLLEHVWDYHFDPQTNVIDVHISRLRSKIDKGSDAPLLHTVRGAGYMIRDIIGKLFRTTAFKLSLAYLVIFALGAGVVLGGIDWNVNQLLDQQIGQTIEAEINGLNEQYDTGGIRQLVTAVERRTEQPGSSLYLVTNFAGETLAGNVETLPPGVIDRPGLVETSYERRNDARPSHLALARVFLLPSGFRLLVGRDLEERENLRNVMIHALFTSLFWVMLVGLVGGLVVSLKILRRVDAMNASAKTIMTGDLSRRLPLAGTGDELDRLAENLNAMIARIAELMVGLREVSDNIAHDLRTPLTRLRNGAEEALRSDGDVERQRAALERVIGEADGLIAIFNALLMIARAEAGSGQDALTEGDAGEIVSDVVELYEPSAEEAGVTLGTSLAPGLLVRSNRELLGQGVANLIDNALKYGVTPGGGSAITVSAQRAGDRIEIAVADRGQGIPAADRAHVLERFVRLESARSRPGSGLGLSLAAAIARLHGGDLRLADNAPGLAVIISLPAVTPDRSPGGPSASRTASPQALQPTEVRADQRGTGAAAAGGETGGRA